MTVTNNPSPACPAILMLSVSQGRQGPFFRNRRYEHKQTAREEKDIAIPWPTDAFFHNELLRCFQNWGTATLNMQRRLPSLWLQCKEKKKKNPDRSGFAHQLEPNAMHLKHGPPPHTAVLWGCQYKQMLNSYWSPEWESQCHAESIKILKADNTYSKVSPGICSLSRWAFMVDICYSALL